MEKFLKYVDTALLIILVVIGVALLSNGGKFGALGEPNPTTLDSGEWTAYNDVLVDDLEVKDDAAIKGDLAVTGNTTNTGNITASGTITYKQKSTNIAATSIYSTTTLTQANSGTTYYLSASGTTIILPAINTTMAGTNFKFVIKGASTDGNFIIDSAEGDNIEGTLIVAGAVVDCDAEDQINFVTDGENIGDYVDIYSDGTQWLIGDSGVLASGKMTCTDPS